MTYRVAILSDSFAVTALNHKYYQAYLDDQKTKGFLKNSFSLNEIQELIQTSEVVVVESQGQLIGYYLFNSSIEKDFTTKRKLKVKQLIKEGKIPDARYVYHTQAVVDQPYMGNGIGKQLLQNLKKQVCQKFDYLIGYIDKENTNAQVAHARSGWEIFTDVEGGYLAMIKANE